MLRLFGALLTVASLPLTASAQEVRLTNEIIDTTYEIAGKTYKVSRNQNNAAVIEQEFARVARPCPPFCITNMVAADGVDTIGEMEVISFVETNVTDGSGLLLDIRAPSLYERGTIPGAMNMYYPALNNINPFRADIFKALGGVQVNDTWDFSNAVDLTLFANGPWSDEAERAIKDLIAVGYPSEKLNYYRGGLQLWKLFGLTVEVPA